MQPIETRARKKTLAHCEPVTLVTPPNVEPTTGLRHYPEVTGCDCSGQAKTSVTLNPEITEYRDNFAMGSDDYGWINKVYHHI
jgi:hypothetical protein